MSPTWIVTASARQGLIIQFVGVRVGRLQRLIIHFVIPFNPRLRLSVPRQAWLASLCASANSRWLLQIPLRVDHSPKPPYAIPPSYCSCCDTCRGRVAYIFKTLNRSKKSKPPRQNENDEFCSHSRTVARHFNDMCVACDKWQMLCTISGSEDSNSHAKSRSLSLSLPSTHRNWNA